MKRTALFLVLLLQLAVASSAVARSTVISIGTLITCYQSDDDRIYTLLSDNGYRSKGWIHEEGFNTQYGRYYYSKNCTVSRTGKVTPRNRSTASLVTIGSIGFGPFITLTVYSRSAYQQQMRILKQRGFRYVERDQYGNVTYRHGKVYVDVNTTGGTCEFCIRH